MKTRKLFLAMAVSSLTFFTACEDGLFSNDDSSEADQEVFLNGTWGQHPISDGSLWHRPDDFEIQISTENEYVRNDTSYYQTMYFKFPLSLTVVGDTIRFGSSTDRGGVSNSFWGRPNSFLSAPVDTGWVYYSYYGKTQSDDAATDNTRDAVGSFEVQYLDHNTNNITTISADFHLRDYSGNW